MFSMVFDLPHRLLPEVSRLYDRTKHVHHWASGGIYVDAQVDDHLPNLRGVGGGLAESVQVREQGVQVTVVRNVGSDQTNGDGSGKGAS